MRTEIARYQNGRQTLRLLGLFLLLSVGLIIFFADLQNAIKAGLFILLLPVVIIAHKKINASVIFLGHYTVSFDLQFLYYTTLYNEIKIPLENIDSIRMLYSSENDSEGGSIICFQAYKIVYTQGMKTKNVRFWVSEKDIDKCGEFKQLVYASNPKVQPGSEADLLFEAQDKVTGILNKISEKIFPPKGLP